MAKSDKSDPTEDPKFQKVVQHFLKTPPRPHESDKREGKEGGGTKKENRRPRQSEGD